MKSMPEFAFSTDPIEVAHLMFASADCDAVAAAQPEAEVSFDREALFRTLIKEYGKSLYYFIFKRVGHPDDAQEIAQQTMVEAACGLTSFRGEAELSTWIFGIAANLARNHITRAPQNRHSFEPEMVLDGCASDDLRPCEQLSQKQGLTLVSEAIEKMPAEMAQALNLVAIEELSYRDAAAELNVPVGTVRSRVSRARAVIKEHMLASGFLVPA
jgi:RNA polymerase sigma-70 factor (ECF subfamily)